MGSPQISGPRADTCTSWTPGRAIYHGDIVCCPGRLNPEEYFNGWIKLRVRDDVSKGVGTLADPIRTIYNAISDRMALIPTLCRNWVKKLYGGVP